MDNSQKTKPVTDTAPKAKWLRILMNKKVIYYAIFFICLAVLAAFYFLADPISPDDQGPSYELEQLIKSIIICAFGLIFSRFLTLIFLKPIEKKRGHPLPKMVYHLVLIVVLAIVACVILISIYGKDIGWIITSVLAGSALLAHAEATLIQNSCAGIEMDFKRFFEPGDWIQWDGKAVQIIHSGLLQTEVEDALGVRILINNSQLANGGLINYNRPTPDYWDTLNITLGQDIPIERAIRLLQSAAMSSEGVLNQQAKAFAREFTEGNIIYLVKFKVKCCEEAFTTHNNVMREILVRLHEHGISIADSGECKVMNIPVPSPQPKFTSALDVVKMTPLFRDCSDNEMREIADGLTLHIFHPGEIIIEEKSFGSTMYFIAEGAVEVSLATSQETPEKDRCHICYIANHSFFGENGVLYDSPRNARVSAFSEVILYRLTKEALIKIVKKSPEILEKMTEVIVQRTQEREDKMDEAKNRKDEAAKKKSEFLTAFKKFLGLA